eukprot:m.271170 g.271170  ORF g.271170 m.271170 type:complete len:382 (+) comp93720_c0_seq1:190-1335(+)
MTDFEQTERPIPKDKSVCINIDASSTMPPKAKVRSVGNDTFTTALRALDTRLVWQIILPAAAECTIAEVIPMAKSETGIDLASSLANIVGAYVAGILLAVEHGSQNSSVKSLCVMTQAWFLNVFTSFPFVPVHGAEMAVKNGLFHGVAYVSISLVLSIYSFELGRRPTEKVLKQSKKRHWSHSLDAERVRHRILVTLICLIFLTLTKTNWYLGHSLMVDSDLALIVNKGIATLVGMALAIGGVHLGDHFGATHNCNFLSCCFVLAAFVWVRSSYGKLENTVSQMIFAKFVGSFCGAFSGYTGFLGDMGKAVYAQKPTTAYKIVMINAGIAIFWTFVFYSIDGMGFEIYSHPLHPVYSDAIDVRGGEHMDKTVVGLGKSGIG